MIAQLNAGSNLVNNSWKIIENLDLKAKSELMILLAEEIANSALKTTKKKEEDVVFELAGSWKDDRTADEMVEDIYSSRISNQRFLESLDD
jgi:hypothetical protein